MTRRAMVPWIVSLSAWCGVVCLGPFLMKTQATVRVPEDFFLRPHLYRDKFPEERTIIIAPEVEARIQAQDAAGHLVFTETLTTAQPGQ